MKALWEGDPTSDNADAIMFVTMAEKAAKEGDGWLAVERLQKTKKFRTGRWVFEVATSIRARVVVDILKSAEVYEPETRISPAAPMAPPPALIVVGRKKKKGASKAITVSSDFKLVFLSIFAIALLSGAVQSVMAFTLPDPTKTQQGVFESMGFAWKLRLGAIVGLLGGKALK